MFYFKTPSILQLSETECGVASLAAIFSYYGVSIPLDELREQCGSSRDGCKASTLLQVAKNHGFEANAFRVEIEDIKKSNYPVIVYWRFQHYVIMDRYRKNKFYINDPAEGRYVVSKEEFDQCFTGVILSIFPVYPVIRRKKQAWFISFLLKTISQFKKEFIFIVLCSLLSSFFLLCNSSLSKIFIDYCVIKDKKEWIFNISIFYMVLGAGFTILTSLQKWYQFNLSYKAGLIKFTETLSHFLKLPIIYYSVRQKNEIISVLNQAYLLIDTVFKSLTTGKMSFIYILLCLMIMIKIDYVLVYFSSALLLLLYLGHFCLSRYKIYHEKQALNARNKWMAYCLSSVRNIETIKSCSLEERIFNKWQNLFINKLSFERKTHSFSSIMSVIDKSYIYFNTLSILFLGGYRIQNNFLSIGDLIAYYSINLVFCGHISSFLQSIIKIQTASIFYERIHSAISFDKDKRFSSFKENDIFNDSILSISCKNMSFYYNKTGNPVLKNINLTLSAGCHIAFVGRSGSGKSTLAKLLCALYSPDSGKICLNDKNIHEFSEKDFPALFSYVSQESHLFSGSIYDNITAFNPSISLSFVQSAIQFVCLEELIAERGLYTKMDAHTHGLSGGEKQRIEIARALLQDTPIMILDEATSALDLETEKKIIGNLRSYSKTILFIAHRLSTIQHCQQIIVMDKGEIVEQGVHHELIKNKSYYFNLVQDELRDDA